MTVAYHTYRSGWTRNAKILSVWWHGEHRFTHGIDWRRLALRFQISGHTRLEDKLEHFHTVELLYCSFRVPAQVRTPRGLMSVPSRNRVVFAFDPAWIRRLWPSEPTIVADYLRLRFVIHMNDTRRVKRCVIITSGSAARPVLVSRASRSALASYRKVTTCRSLCCAGGVLYLQTIFCRCRTTERRGHRAECWVPRQLSDHTLAR